MNDKLIQRAVECYTEKLEEENKTLKAFIAQIGDAFTCDKNRSDEEIERMKKGIRTFKCAVCGCKFEAEMCEYKIQPCDYNENAYVCNCPNCGFTAREQEG